MLKNCAKFDTHYIENDLIPMQVQIQRHGMKHCIQHCTMHLTERHARTDCCQCARLQSVTDAHLHVHPESRGVCHVRMASTIKTPKASTISTCNVTHNEQTS